MFSFDMGSFPARNPEAVIDAFRQAFAPSVHDVALVIKVPAQSYLCGRHAAVARALPVIRASGWSGHHHDRGN